MLSLEELIKEWGVFRFLVEITIYFCLFLLSEKDNKIAKQY